MDKSQEPMASIPSTELKVCPLLQQSETKRSPLAYSETIAYTNSYFSKCLGTMCAAYDVNTGYCKHFGQNVLVVDGVQS